MNTTAQELTVFNNPIRVKDNLYCLNDIHRASGGQQKHRPNYFMGNQQTKDLAAVIENAGIPAIKKIRGAQGGTYVCRKLVVAYAMWISPEFYDHVLEVFLSSEPAHEKQLPPSVISAITDMANEASVHVFKKVYNKLTQEAKDRADKGEQYMIDWVKSPSNSNMVVIPAYVAKGMIGGADIFSHGMNCINEELERKQLA